MAQGGDISKNALLDSFAKIKEDIQKLNTELYDLKLEQKKLLEENHELKKKSNSSIDKELLREIVQEALKSAGAHKSPVSINPQINKKRKGLLKNRIYLLADQKSMSLSEIKEIVVDEEGLCSKATFYRYVEKMRKKGSIDFAKINDIEVLVRIN
jgi:regulator of replication initiation timing